MNKLIEKLDYKITYGREKQRWDGLTFNWVGIITKATSNNDSKGYRINYREKDNCIEIFSVIDDMDKDIDRGRLYFAFPLIKLIEKAKKKGINEVCLSMFTKDIEKALSPFWDVRFDGDQRKFVLNEARILETIGMMDLLSYHPTIWEVNRISNNLLFRTKATYVYIGWDQDEQSFSIREKHNNNDWDYKKVRAISKASEVESYLRNLELTETFQPLMVENSKRMFYQLSGKTRDEVSQQELKNFLYEIERFTTLIDIERQLINKVVKYVHVYNKRVNFYEFNDFVIGSAKANHLDTKVFIEKKEHFHKAIYHFMKEDLLKEIESSVVV